MSTRAIHMDRSYFTTIGDSRRIPDQGVVKFTHLLANYYKQIYIQGNISYINEIEFDYNTSIFRINTSAVTFNNFIIYWAVCLKTVNSTQMPCFSLVVRNEDQSIFTMLPSTDTRKTTVVYGNSILHLPTPAAELPPVSYYLTLVNTTGADCFYSTKAITIADILIVCIDDE